MKFRLLLIFTVIASFTTNVLSQGRILPILETSVDVRSAGMGGVTLGDTKQMHIYSNPAASVFSDEWMNIDVSSVISPMTDVGRLTQYNLATNIELHPNRALFLGARWRGGLKIPTTVTNYEKGFVSPYEWTADIGYAFRVIPEVVAYATATYFQSDMGRQTKGLDFSVGAGYQKLLRLCQTSTLLTLGFRLSDIGKPIRYGETGIPYSLPTSIQAGGDWQIALAPQHQMTYALSMRYFTPKDARLLTVSTGVEYCFNNMVSARIGYQYGQKEASRLTCGIGAGYKGFHADISYQHSLSKAMGSNSLLVGVGYAF